SSKNNFDQRLAYFISQNNIDIKIDPEAIQNKFEKDPSVISNKKSQAYKALMNGYSNENITDKSLFDFLRIIQAFELNDLKVLSREKNQDYGISKVFQTIKNIISEREINEKLLEELYEKMSYNEFEILDAQRLYNKINKLDKNIIDQELQYKKIGKINDDRFYNAGEARVDSTDIAVSKGSIYSPKQPTITHLKRHISNSPGDRAEKRTRFVSQPSTEYLGEISKVDSPRSHVDKIIEKRGPNTIDQGIIKSKRRLFSDEESNIPTNLNPDNSKLSHAEKIIKKRSASNSVKTPEKNVKIGSSSPQKGTRGSPNKG
ncbi:MAG: hypothetical protein K0R02_1212, partial [Rickettsiaceae bacterium]|nr:hypothetical protein [Rickettsiaceae bacterium]